MDATGDFDEFVRAQWPSLVRSLRLVAGSEQSAEDIAQDAFAKAYSRWARLRNYDRPGAWVRRVALRDAVRARRRLGRGRQLEAKAVAAESTVHTDKPAMSATIADAIGTLSPQQRACVVLRHLDGYTNTEIAEILGCSPATVGVHLHRAKAHLTALLTQHHLDGERT